MLKKILVTNFLVLVIFIGLNAEVYYPWKNVYIGALEWNTWGGLVIAMSDRAAFAFRLRIQKGEEIADREDLLYLISEVGPHSPDGQYARIKIDTGLPFGKKYETPIPKKPSPKSQTLVFEWSRQDESVVVGRVKIPRDVGLQIVHYFPWDSRGDYAVGMDGQLTGESHFLPETSYLFWTQRKGTGGIDPASGEYVLNFSMEKNNLVYFIAAVRDDLNILKNQIYRYKNTKTIDSILEEEENRYRQKRVQVDGLYQGVEQAVTNNLFWTALYQSGKHRYYSPAGRRWIFPRQDGENDLWTIFQWDSFFSAIEMSVESSKHAHDILNAVLETQYPNGNLPNWRGSDRGTLDRSQPPIGAFAVLKVFQKTGNIEILKTAYPILKKWHRYWKTPDASGRINRDGNKDGLLEWGSNPELLPSQPPLWEMNVTGKVRAAWESGQDDLPNWDGVDYNAQTGTFMMNCVDLNALYTLDCWCLAEIAKILDFRQDYRTFLAEYEIMKNLVNDNLWDNKEGFYFDRYWDGRFSTKKAASNFFPLIARIPNKEQARRLRSHLFNPNEFWGDYILPTISRNDTAFKDQQAWRGTVWPPTNYLVYQGLKAYHFDSEASEFAEKGVELFMRSWKNFQICPENYDSRTGEAGGQRFRSIGPLFSLIAMEEYIDFTPWEGFRFGMLSPKDKGRLSRMAFHGRHYDVLVSPRKIKLWEEGKNILSVNGSAIFRRFLYSENEVSFNVRSIKKRKIKIRLLVKGKYQLEIDNQVKRVFENDTIKFVVPEGAHTVLILLLSKEE